MMKTGLKTVKLKPTTNKQITNVNNFWTRTLTGAAFVTVMAGGIIWNFWSYVFLFSAVSLLGLWEFLSLTKRTSFQKAFGVILGSLFVSLAAAKYLFQVWDIYFEVWLPVLILIFPSFLIIKLFLPLKSTETHFTILPPVLFGILYVIFPFCLLIYFYASLSYFKFEINSGIILGFFFLIWSNDTFAYLVGSTIGKRKLFERISPKKTWEGTLGGLFCTQGIAYLISMYFTELAPFHWHVVALIVSVFGTLGDLVESMEMRYAIP